MSDNCSNESCPMHNRIDQTELDDNTMQMITYVGEYVVVTEVAWEIAAPAVQYGVAMGVITPSELYITAIGWLGSDTATMSSSLDDVETERYYRHWVRHDDVDNLKDVHNAIADAVRDGQLDLSEYRGQEYMDECRARYDKLIANGTDNGITVISMDDF